MEFSSVLVDVMDYSVVSFGRYKCMSLTKSSFDKCYLIKWIFKFYLKVSSSNAQVQVN